MEEELSANAQKITAEMQYEIRKTIVRMLKKGMKGNEIAKILDVSKGHVSNVKKAYVTGKHITSVIIIKITFFLNSFLLTQV